MSTLNKWVTTVSKEDADTEVVDSSVIVEEPVVVEEPLVDTIEETQIENEAAVDELDDAIEAQAAIEAYTDLVRGEKARGRQIDKTTAQAIYIGLEHYGFSTVAMPSVESFGSLGVSVELLDKLKDGAKAVGNKIKELYEYLVNLVKKAFSSTEAKVDKVEEQIKETIVKIEATPEVANSAVKFKTDAGNRLFSKGKFIGGDAKAVKKALDDSIKTIEQYLDGVKGALDLLYADDKADNTNLGSGAVEKYIKALGGSFKSEDGNKFVSTSMGLDYSNLIVHISPNASTPSEFARAGLEGGVTSKDEQEVSISDAHAYMNTMLVALGDVRRWINNLEKDTESYLNKFESAKSGGDAVISNKLSFLHKNYFNIAGVAPSSLARVLDECSRLAMVAVASVK